MINKKKILVITILLTGLIIASVFPWLLNGKSSYFQNVVLTATLLAILWYTYETRKMQQAVNEQVEVANRQTGIAAQQIEQIIAQTDAIKSQTEIARQQVGEAVHQTEELVYQRKLSLLPKLHVRLDDKIFIDHTTPYQHGLRITNIGNGSAINVTVDEFAVTFGNQIAYIWFGRLILLEPTKSSSKTEKHPWVRVFIRYENGDSFDPVEAVEVSLYKDEPIKFLKKYYGGEPIVLTVRFQDIDGNRYNETARIELRDENFVTWELGIPLKDS